MEERIAAVSEEAVLVVKELYHRYRLGWAKISSAVKHKFIATNLTRREHEIAKLCVFGYNTKEIANILYISVSTVKQTIVRIMNKTGVEDKEEFSLII